MEPLTEVEARVVGCLVEKQRTVPDTYPLSLNALLLACNQATNRDPVVNYDERTVLSAIDSLKAKGIARMVHPATGQRVTKYRHVLDEALSLDGGEVAIVAVLLLRGPQTAAELRTRTERLHPFGDLFEVEATLDALVGRELVVRLERRHGEREVRWQQLLAPSRHEEPVMHGLEVTRTENAGDPGLEERVSALEAEVAELRSVVDRLRDLL